MPDDNTMQTLAPRSTIATLHRPEIDSQVDPQPYKDAGMMAKPTGTPIEREPTQPIQAKVNPDNRAQPGMYERVKSIFTGSNPYVK